MTRPLVLLDVDGVLNAVPTRRRADAWTDWRTGNAVADGRRFRITWSPSVVSAVLSWREVADVHWLTTWGHDANRSLRHLLDMPELPVAGTYDDDGTADASTSAGQTHADVAPAAPDPLTGRWWKFDVVRRLVRADPSRRLVWIDDDLVGQDDIRVWMRREVDCLLVGPRLTTGLTAPELEAVDRFLREQLAQGEDERDG